MTGRDLGRVELTYVGERRKYPFDKMEPGDWFFVPLYTHDRSIEVLRNSIASAAKNASKKTGHTYRASVTRTAEVGINVYCVAPGQAQMVEPVKRPELVQAVQKREQTYTLNPPRGSNPRSITLLEESRRAILDQLMWELRYIDASHHGHPVFVILGPTFVEIGSGLKEMYEPGDSLRFVEMAAFQRYTRKRFEDLTIEQMCAYTNSWLEKGKPEQFVFDTIGTKIVLVDGTPAGTPAGTEADAEPF